MNEQDRIALRQRLKDSFPLYAKKCLFIRTKDGRVEQLQLNKAQLYMHDYLEKQLAEKGRVRAIILKGRQQGCSTYVEARYFWKVTHRRGVRAFILTHLDEATQNIYGMVKRFFDNCPLVVRPSISASNAKELVFNKLDSSYRVGTAKSSGTGRGDTLQYFHGSEVAYWSNAEEHVSGVLQAVPDLKGTEVILESTAAGAQGLFYHMCKAAQAGHGEYQLIFVPWFWQDEYRKDAVDFTATAEELSLKEQYGLDDLQLVWRRAKIAEFSGDISRFRREYPCTIDEAFSIEVIGALWTRELINKNRVIKMPCQASRIVVAIDPAVTSNATSDETGIVVCALGDDGHGYVLEDISGRYSPAEWARKAIAAYYKYEADRIIAETNNGGEMVEHTIRTLDANVSFKSVHASRGKKARAEPIAALDEQGRIHHVGTFPTMEDQMCSWISNGAQASPDRIDARVWGFTELMLGKKASEPRIWG